MYRKARNFNNARVSNKTSTISIAGLPVKIHSNDPAIIKIISKRYSRFISKKTPIFNLTIQINPLFIGLPYRRRTVLSSKREYKKGIIKCKSIFFKGEIDLKRKIAFLELSKINEELKISCVQNFLRVLYANILLHNKGLLIHSANVIKDKSGYLFFGKSGSGKTTISKALAKDSAILSDDMAVIKKTNGVYKVYGSPFWGMLRKKLNQINRAAPVKGAFKLIKANSDGLKIKAKKNAIIDLLACASFLPGDKRTYSILAATLYELAGNIPVYDLYFTKKCKFWRLIKCEQPKFR